MPSFLLKDIPPDLHRRLKEDAARNHRSMARHVVAILEEKLKELPAQEYPPPVKVAQPISDASLNMAKNWGRR